MTAVTGEDGTYCVDISTVSCIIPEVNPADCPECDTAITEADCALIDQIRNLTTGRPHNLTPAQVLAADVNGSGTINTLDVIIMQIYCFYDPEVLSDATLEAIGTCQYIPSSNATGELECWDPELCPQTCGETDFTLVFAGDINGSCSSCEVDPEINPFPREFVLSDNSFAFSIACNTSLALEDFYFLFEKNSNDDPISYELNSRINEAVQLEIVEYDKYFAITGILSQEIILSESESLLTVPKELDYKVLDAVIINGESADLLDDLLIERSTPSNNSNNFSVLSSQGTLIVNLEYQIGQRISISDITGNTISRIDCDKAGELGSYQLSILNEGIYFVTVYHENSEPITKKVYHAY